MRRPPFLPRAAYATPLAIFIAIIAVHAQAPEPFRAPADRPVDVKHIRLDLKVDLPGKTVDGVATITLEALRPLTSLSLDAVEFEVKKVTLVGDENGGTPIPFTHDGKHLERSRPGVADAPRCDHPCRIPSPRSEGRALFLRAVRA